MLTMESMDDDDALVVIIVGEDGTEASGPFNKPIKTELIDDCNEKNVDLNSILEAAELHGQYIGVKEVYDGEYLEDSDKQESDNNDTYAIDKTAKSFKNEKSYSNYEESYIAQLQKNFPKMRKDEEYLVAHLCELMKHTKPPEPPAEFCQNIDGKLICAYCDAESETMNSASRHYQKKHGTRYLVCCACGYNFKCTTSLYKHELRCNSPYASIVLKARGRYLGRKGRRRPFLTSNKFDPFDSNNKKLERFYCSMCSANFKFKNALAAHELMHKGIRPFQCDQCPSAFTSAVALTRHINTLHSEKEFICDVCKRSFKLKNTLVTHMNTHLPLRKYPCDRCQRRYAQKTALRHHIDRDHLNIPPSLACAVCLKRFPRMSNLKSHMKAKHGMTVMTPRMLCNAMPTMNEEELKQATLVFNNSGRLANYASVQDLYGPKCSGSQIQDKTKAIPKENKKACEVVFSGTNNDSNGHKAEISGISQGSADRQEISCDQETLHETNEGKILYNLKCVEPQEILAHSKDAIRTSLEENFELEFVKIVPEGECISPEFDLTENVIIEAKLDENLFEINKNVHAERLSSKIENAKNDYSKKVNEKPKNKRSIIKRTIATRSGDMKTRRKAVTKKYTKENIGTVSTGKSGR